MAPTLTPIPTPGHLFKKLATATTTSAAANILLDVLCPCNCESNTKTFVSSSAIPNVLLLKIVRTKSCMTNTFIYVNLLKYQLLL